jgi:hypothetical protein
MDVAHKNLAAMPAKFLGPPSGAGAHYSITNDGYDASRLLLVNLIRQFKVSGQTIAMIPSRECLAVVGSEDVEGLSQVLKGAANALRGPHPISGIALRLEDDVWVPWLPDVSHPLYNGFEKLRFQSLEQAQQ